MKHDGARQIILSASDLMRFQGCSHVTALDYAHVNGGSIAPAEDSEDAVLFQGKGNQHEQAYLDRLVAEGRQVGRIAKDGISFAEAAEQTQTALHSGVEIIYQAALGSGRWAGYADFLERVDQPSRLGAFSYEPTDTKLKRSAHPSHVLQLALYADLLAQVQGVVPRHAHVVLGDGQRVSLLLNNYSAYVRRVMHRLVAFVDAPQRTRPEPVAACSLCRWRDHCDDEWDRQDSTWLVAGITRLQHRKFEAAGVTTLPQLSALATRPPKIAPNTWTKVQTQARLQDARRRGGRPSYSLRAIEPGKGLSRLPKPDPQDLFFDMEGDPLIEGGLEYLFGVYRGDHDRYDHFWAHDSRAEEVAVRNVLTLFTEHRQSHPRSHIYHYGDYEVTALKRLASRYGVGEEMLDQLLRKKAFVNLLRVVQQGLTASEPSYSLKDLEAFYFPKRDHAVASGGASIVAYENWRERQDPTTLDNIRAYNEVDCRSTKGMQEWLIAKVRPTDLPWFTDAAIANSIPSPSAEDPFEIDRAAWREKFEAAIPRLGQPLAELLFELCFFHRREDKPAWWAMFDRAERDSEDLIDDLESLAGLIAVSAPKSDKKSQVRQYRYPEQETKLRVGSRTKLRENLATVNIVEMNPQASTVVVKFGPGVGDPPDAVDLIPAGPLDAKVLVAAVRNVVSTIYSGLGTFPAIEALLRRDHPKLKGLDLKNIDLTNDPKRAQTVSKVIAALDESCLPIQGPPGTGKTYVASEAILRLVKAGKRVAVSAHAHKAIDNLLRAVADRASEQKVSVSMVKKGGDDGDDETEHDFEVTNNNADDRISTYSVVGGTAWLFARPEYRNKFDYLIIDEAGQMSLANAIAVGVCARNIVLVGDPMQLPQPLQGAHPGETGLSSLEYLLVGHATVPPDRGLFLPVTRRMHSSVCKYISVLAYEGRLTNDPATDRQKLIFKGDVGVPAVGLSFMEIPHAGNSQSSDEEATALARLYKSLLGERFRDRAGKVRAIRTDDILVVSPYNAQVNRLRRTLPKGARVGTVDKFQGQEAPVCLISMATSSGDELPRNIEFLFSTNRLNVAVSRAQALAVVFASPRLLDVPCRTLEQMRLVNGLCLLREMAGSQG